MEEGPRSSHVPDVALSDDLSAEDSMAGAETSAEDVDASFAQMSKRFGEAGGEIYLPADATTESRT